MAVNVAEPNVAEPYVAEPNVVCKARGRGLSASSSSWQLKDASSLFFLCLREGEQRGAAGEDAKKHAMHADNVNVNAGTVEFILAPDGQHYFLEVNPRARRRQGWREDRQALRQPPALGGLREGGVRAGRKGPGRGGGQGKQKQR